VPCRSATARRIKSRLALRISCALLRVRPRSPVLAGARPPSSLAATRVCAQRRSLQRPALLQRRRSRPRRRSPRLLGPPPWWARPSKRPRRASPTRRSRPLRRQVRHITAAAAALGIVIDWGGEQTPRSTAMKTARDVAPTRRVRRLLFRAGGALMLFGLRKGRQRKGGRQRHRGLPEDHTSWVACGCGDAMRRSTTWSCALCMPSWHGVVSCRWLSARGGVGSTVAGQFNLSAWMRGQRAAGWLERGSALCARTQSYAPHGYARSSAEPAACCSPPAGEHPWLPVCSGIPPSCRKAARGVHTPAPSKAGVRGDACCLRVLAGRLAWPGCCDRAGVMCRGVRWD